MTLLFDPFEVLSDALFVAAIGRFVVELVHAEILLIDPPAGAIVGISARSALA
jgi:hypothetical protein